MKFHSRTGGLVRLSNDNRTAKRSHASQEFNNGLVFSGEPLVDGVPFEVRIDKKIQSWSGSIEIGITALDPDVVALPTSATGFRESTWLMSGSSIMKDGHSLIDDYGRDLDLLNEGDTVSVLRSSNGELHFRVNNIDQGVAMSCIPPRVFAIVDMYGKCAQISLVTGAPDDNREIEASSLMATFNDVANTVSQVSQQITMLNQMEQRYNIMPDEQLTFHEKCGSLVKLSNGRQVAQRLRPLDEFNNGVVMTNRPLRDQEMFEIRLEHLVDKWSGSIEVGVTTHNPSCLEFPTTMTNMRSGTIMMSGYGILINGKGTRRDYSQHSLDELMVNDTIGLMRKSNGFLHYYINGVDQGVAATATPAPVWGVIDLYGMAVRATIIDHSCDTDAVTEHHALPDPDNAHGTVSTVGPLLFHQTCGEQAVITGDQRTAQRPHATDDLDCGEVFTNRPLQVNELFEVRIDYVVDCWDGSMEIGVTTHSPSSQNLTRNVSDTKPDTWMISTGTLEFDNGNDNYGHCHDQLKIGDRIGVRLRANGDLHFYINGVDQGIGASNIPQDVYGVIDLYGPGAQVSILNLTDGCPPSDAPNKDELRFHRICGETATIESCGTVATRHNATTDFTGAIVLSNRPLRDNEAFHIRIDSLVNRWSGSLVVGVVLVSNDEINSSYEKLTELPDDTWILSGTTILKDGGSVNNNYPLNLDCITEGSSVGVMRCADGTLHFYLDGADMGVACQGVPPGVYAICDMYGQCAQISVVSNPPSDSEIPLLRVNDERIQEPITDQPVQSTQEISHRLSQFCGRNVTIKNYCCSAVRNAGYDHGLCFSSEALGVDEVFEIVIDQVSTSWVGSFRIGLTTLCITNSASSLFPASANQITKPTWLICGTQVLKNSTVIKQNYCPSLDRIEMGCSVGVKRDTSNSMHLLINGVDLGPAAHHIPKNVHAIIDLYGMVEAISVISNAKSRPNSEIPRSLSTNMSQRIDVDLDQDTAKVVSLEFHKNCGHRVELCKSGLTAQRTSGYDHGLVVCKQSLSVAHPFHVRVDRLDTSWNSSLILGLTAYDPEDHGDLPTTACGFRQPCMVIQGDNLITNGTMMKLNRKNLDDVQVGETVGLGVDERGHVHLFNGGVDLGVIMENVFLPCFPFVDLYGQCTKVTIVPSNEVSLVRAKDSAEKSNFKEDKKEKSGFYNLMTRDLRWSHLCEYLSLCQRFILTLAIPAGFFDPRLDCCYCEHCHKLRGGDSYQKHGDPPKEYSLPLGWCRLGLRQPPKSQLTKVYEKWHVAFHGTEPQCVRRILDVQDLIGTGQSLISPLSRDMADKDKPESLDGEKVIVSPTIRYAGLIGSSNTKYDDSKTHQQHQVHLAFQLWIKPRAYSIGPSSLTDSHIHQSGDESFDPRFCNSEVEWCSKERGSRLLTGLLIYIS